MARPIIGILVCDHVSPRLRDAARDRDYGEMYAEMLTVAEPDLATRIYDVVAGELPADPTECDAWIVTGSRYDADQEEPWLVALGEFLRRLHGARARAVGICFGHQAVAHALGGRIDRADGWAAGPQEMAVEPTDWFEGGRVSLNAMHRDVVTALPPGARPIGTGTTAEYPIYIVDDTILGIQDHPEFDASYTRALIEVRESHMGDIVAAALAKVDSVSTDNLTVGSWIVNFLLDRR